MKDCQKLLQHVHKTWNHIISKLHLQTWNHLSKSHSNYHSFRLLCFAIGLSVGIVTSLYLTHTFPVFTAFSQASLYSVHSLELEISPSQTAVPPTSNNVTEDSWEEQKTLTMHGMDDEELFERASVASNKKKKKQAGLKVAFMFLVKGPLHLRVLWEKFFGGNEGYYSIYVHADPSFSETVPQDSVFHARNIPSKPVYWGDISMVDAERRLLGNALLEPSNERFVLLSESCIPLFNFSTVCAYLLGSERSFVGSFDDPGPEGRGRYNPIMRPAIEPEMWLKAPQWFEMRRELALHVIADRTYYQLFRTASWFSDEHYLPTFLRIVYPEASAKRSVTWVDWSVGGPHPATFGWGHITDEFLNQIRFGSGPCDYNGVQTSICFLFARKFAPETLEPLLRVAPMLLGFDP